MSIGASAELLFLSAQLRAVSTAHSFIVSTAPSFTAVLFAASRLMFGMSASNTSAFLSDLSALLTSALLAELTVSSLKLTRLELWDLQLPHLLQYLNLQLPRFRETEEPSEAY